MTFINVLAANTSLPAKAPWIFLLQDYGFGCKLENIKQKTSNKLIDIQQMKKNAKCGLVNRIWRVYYMYGKR